MPDDDQTFEAEMLHIGDRLRVARNNAGYTQKQVGSIIGVRESTVSGWETGTSKFSMGNLFALYELYQQPLAYYFPNQLSLSTPTEDDALRSEVAMLLTPMSGKTLKLSRDLIKAVANHDEEESIGALDVVTDRGKPDDE